MDYRKKKWFIRDRKGRSILQICLDVHMTCKCTLSRTCIEQEKDVKLLNYALENWIDSDCYFDKVVKRLVEVVISEDWEMEHG